MTTRLNHRHAVLALSMACALSLPLASHAQSSSREQQLENRVTQLEQQLQELKQMLQQQQNSNVATAGAAGASAATVASAPATAGTPVAPATPVFTTAPGMSVALHGFVSASAFSQDRSFTFGNGSNAEFPMPGSSGDVSGFDARNTRFWLDISDARFSDNWTGGGRIEMDFYGGYNGTGAYSRQQLTPRLRQAYMDLNNADMGSKVRIGQQWDLMFPLDNIPDSLTHIAFPLGFGTGFVGWRFPGVVWMQDLNKGSSGAKLRLDVGVFDGNWSGPGDNLNYLTAGNAGFRPQVEARLRLQDETWVAYLATHYSEVDLRGVDGNALVPVKDKIDSIGYEVGGQWKPGSWVFKGLVYSGSGLGELFGAMSQFGDIQETGGFLQVGYSFTPHWSANAFYGTSKPKSQDVIQWMGLGSSGRLESQQSALSLNYSSGAYALGIEYMYDKLDYTTDGVIQKRTNGNQLSLSALYKF